jgi:hypothetical protein
MDKEESIVIEEERLLDKVPSGSGIAIWKDSLYIVSDDAPFLYRLFLKDYSYEQFALKGYSDAGYRIPKKVKPDFEGAAIGELDGRKYLFAFGSGSKSPGRDSLLMVSLADLSEQKIIPLSSFYKGLQAKTNTSPEQWNIEGVAIGHDTLMLFNRGNNMVVEIGWQEFISYIKSGGDSPELHHYALKLPRHDGHLARISGACELNGEGDILFCASIEDTPNWYTDGPVIGSYVGIFNRHTKSLSRADLLLDRNGRPLTEKVESIEMLKVDEDGGIRVIVVTDNDKGQSRLMRILLKGTSKGQRISKRRY